MRTEPNRTGDWSEMAPHRRQVGPPLRPVAEDLGFCREAVEEWARHRGAPRVLLLGVTPELYRLPWPEGTDVQAVDWTQAMIESEWPGPRQAVQCEDWLAMSLPNASRDIALCDGGLHLISHPEEQQRLVSILHKILADEGLCILRLFVPPAQRESPEAVLGDLLEGKVSSLNILKLRLGMSLLESASAGVELGTIWRTLHEVVPDLEALALRIGWTREHMRAIEAYRGSKARYCFASVGEVAEMFCRTPGWFKVHSVKTPSYELGERCPTIVLQRCSRPGEARAPVPRG